jgi:N-acetylglutamate synthase-like GNAT family acetyltransferase
MIIRVIKEKDTPAVANLTADCYRALATREQYTKDELSGLLAQCGEEAICRQYHDFTAFVAEQDGVVVGVVAIERNEIAQLFVSPTIQGRGIGSGLVAAAEAHMLSSGYAKARAWSATAPTFYVRIGYAVTERKVCGGGPLKGRPLIVLDKVLKTGN